MSCPDCFSGHVHSGEPQGEVTKLHGLDVYVASPAPDATIRGIIIIIPDAFGWEFVNNRILADHYAQKGRYKVYLPDFMNGENHCIGDVVWCWYDEELNLTLCSLE
jgi:dienelactone hydrolase